VIIATKARVRMWDGPDGEGLSRGHLIRAVEDSLRRLHIDTIDLYQCHWPDETTPIEETLSALEGMVQSGKVRAIGLSNYTASQLQEALDTSQTQGIVRCESLQPHYSLLHRQEFEDELADLCVNESIGVIPYSPLAGGFLTGKHRRDTEPESSRGLVKELAANPRAHDVIDILRDIADGNSVPPPQIALAWLMAQPGVTAPIIGARTLDHLLGVVGAVDVTLTDNEIQRLSEASQEF
jgi:aryl-alcohol dehydrogenase-like predicted oxidoreductase